MSIGPQSDSATSKPNSRLVTGVAKPEVSVPRKGSAREYALVYVAWIRLSKTSPQNFYQRHYMLLAETIFYGSIKKAVYEVGEAGIDLRILSLCLYSFKGAAPDLQCCRAIFEIAGMNDIGIAANQRVLCKQAGNFTNTYLLGFTYPRSMCHG